MHLSKRPYLYAVSLVELLEADRQYESLFEAQAILVLPKYATKNLNARVRRQKNTDDQTENLEQKLTQLILDFRVVSQKS